MLEKIKTFFSWHELPDEFKTAKKLMNLGFKLKPNEVPVGRVVEGLYVDVVPAGGEILEEGVEGVEGKLIVGKSFKLYTKEQCTPYRAKPRTIAARKFFDIFVAPMRRDAWIAKTDYTTGKELPSWFQAKSIKIKSNFDLGLDLAHISKHLNYRDMVGVLGQKWTRFAVVDLDLHDIDSYLR